MLVGFDRIYLVCPIFGSDWQDKGMRLRQIVGNERLGFGLNVEPRRVGRNKSDEWQFERTERQGSKSLVGII